jgi:hypothetical protein
MNVYGRVMPAMRLSGATAVLTVGLAVILLGWSSAASAHRGIVLTVHTDGRGSVWVTVAWDDGHPVTERIGATVTLTSTRGERVGPAPLRQRGDAAGVLTYEGTLGVGEWRVVAETGSPSIARCQADIRVAGAAGQPVPSEVRCTPTPAPSTATASTTGNSSARWFVVITVFGFVLIGTTLTYGLIRSRRPRRGSSTRARGQVGGGRTRRR